jgi:hypothetical protein
MTLNKEQTFAVNIRALGHEGTDEEIRQLSCYLRMMIRLQIPASNPLIVPMAIAADVWAGMLDPMPRAEFSAYVNNHILNPAML